MQNLIQSVFHIENLRVVKEANEFQPVYTYNVYQFYNH